MQIPYNAANPVFGPVIDRAAARGVSVVVNRPFAMGSLVSGRNDSGRRLQVVWRGSPRAVSGTVSRITRGDWEAFSDPPARPEGMIGADASTLLCAVPAPEVGSVTAAISAALPVGDAGLDTLLPSNGITSRVASRADSVHSAARQLHAELARIGIFVKMRVNIGDRHTLRNIDENFQRGSYRVTTVNAIQMPVNIPLYHPGGGDVLENAAGLPSSPPPAAFPPNCRPLK